MMVAEGAARQGVWVGLRGHSCWQHSRCWVRWCTLCMLCMTCTLGTLGMLGVLGVLCTTCMLCSLCARRAVTQQGTLHAACSSPQGQLACQH